MKLKIAALLIALPLGMSTMLAKSASAAEFNFNNDHRSTSPVVVSDRPDQNQQRPRPQAARRPEFRRVWMSGHWQPTAHGHRQWIAGHWETRRA